MYLSVLVFCTKPDLNKHMDALNDASLYCYKHELMCAHCSNTGYHAWTLMHQYFSTTVVYS